MNHPQRKRQDQAWEWSKQYQRITRTIENFSRRRWTTLPAPSVSYSAHEGKHLLFQLWVDYFLSWFTTGQVRLFISMIKPVVAGRSSTAAPAILSTEVVHTPEPNLGWSRTRRSWRPPATCELFFRSETRFSGKWHVVKKWCRTCRLDSIKGTLNCRH